MCYPGIGNVFSYVRETYGRTAVASTRQYLNSATKVVRFQCHLHFNQVCFEQHVIPQGLRCKPLVDTPYGSDYERNCLKAHIQENRGITYRTRKGLWTSEATLQRLISVDGFQHVIDARGQAEQLERQKCSMAHQRKLEVLCSNVPSEQQDRTAVFNFSSRTLDESHLSVLAKGMNFAVIPRTIPFSQILANIEDKLRRTDDKAAANSVRNNIVGVLRKARPPGTNLTKAERNALSELRKDDTVVILPADKGKGTVILDRSDYDSKMLDILNDSQHFLKIKDDPTKVAERKLVSELRKLKNEGRMPDGLYRTLFSSNGATPRIYGLPKDHKEGCPLRPIVSFIGVPSYNLSKFLVELIAPVMYRNGRSVRNSFRVL